MKCQKCNAELLEGAKFCTTCGTPVAETSAPNAARCPKCNAPLPENSKFCTTCGTPVAAPAQSEPESDSRLTMVANRISWNIGKGEVACKIRESEFVHYNAARGLIVDDGTTACIKAGGRLIGEIHGGVYDFVDAQELHAILGKRAGGLAGGLSEFGRGIINVLLGKRTEDRIRQDHSDDAAWQSTLDDVIRCLKNNEVFSLSLKLDKSFALVLGSGTADDPADFAPMTVRTQLFDLNIGIRAFFRIDDFAAFSAYYLADAPSVRTETIAREIRPTVQAAVQQVLKDVAFEGQTIPDDVTVRIKEALLACKEQFHGVQLESIVEVATSNEDLARFRQISQALYVSEQELDYLRRTNEFRNRLAAETNSRQVADARNDLQLYQGLQEVNKDKLLTDDEFEKFYTVLSREKRIREARNESEIEAALADIAQTGLLRQEELDNMRIDIAERRYKRGQVFKLMQLRDEIEAEKVRTAGEGEIAIKEMRQQLDLQDMTLNYRKKEDFYADERYDKEREQRIADRKADMELDNAEMEAQLELLRKVKEMERADKQQEIEHEKEMERLHQDRLERQAQMTPEQLMALAAAENMGTEAAARFADSFSAGRNAEQVQHAADQRLADAQRHEDRMMEMFREMKDMATTMTGHIVREKDEQRREYRERLEHQEARLDHTQDSALNYVTRQQSAQTPQPAQHPAPQPSVQAEAKQLPLVCSACGAELKEGMRFCLACGKEID